MIFLRKHAVLWRALVFRKVQRLEREVALCAALTLGGGSRQKKQPRVVCGAMVFTVLADTIMARDKLVRKQSALLTELGEHFQRIDWSFRVATDQVNMELIYGNGRAIARHPVGYSH